jgi:hemerythrin-like domain-containing protein
MDAISLLKTDHKKVLRILADIDSTTDRAEKKRKKLFEDIVNEITVHTKIEEKIFYPALKEYAKAKNIILEAYEEHGLVDKIIADLKRVNYTDEKWKAKFSVLMENLKHHIKEEEKIMFPLSKRLLDKNELKSLGEDMEQLKEDINNGIVKSMLSAVMPSTRKSNDEKTVEKDPEEEMV